MVSEAKTGLQALPTAARSLLIEACLTLVLPAHLALSQWQNGAALSLAALTGIWGVSLVVWWVNIGLAISLKTKVFDRSVLLPAVVMLLAWIFRPSGGEPTVLLRVGIIQSDSSDETQLARLNKVVSEGSDVVVWPELSGMIFAPGGDLRQLEALAKKTSVPFITSYEEPGKPLAANVARLFSPVSTSKPYVKRKPFAGERNVHRAGTDPVAVVLNLTGGKQIPAGLNICFDSCYPWIMRETRQQMQGPGVILLPTLDPPATHGVVQSIHAAYTTFRAAELATPIIRADTTGYSMAVDDIGEVVGSLPPGEATLRVTVPLRAERTTLYRRFGEWFLWADVLGLCLWFVGKRRENPTVRR